MSENKIVKKRGRKSNAEKKLMELNKELAEATPTPPAAPKKRGRKPKGGKIIEEKNTISNNNNIPPNIILHLKCNNNDIANYTNNNNIESFNVNNNKNSELSYLILNKNNMVENNMVENNMVENNMVENNMVENNMVENIMSENIMSENIMSENIMSENITSENIIVENNMSENITNTKNYIKNNNNNDKEIYNKLKELQLNLHINNISDKKSACFWCTYEFDNPPIFIPKFLIQNSYHCYGCFCSPECSVAYLFNENIDSSMKFERYHLSNLIYSKIYNYEKNIKPAPNPYYMLDKYYGNLSITEYRQLLTYDRLLFVIDKPLTRMLPEIHEDNDDFLLSKNASYNNLKIKKNKNNNSSKKDIMNENFGFS